jgi:hypothetical protein
VDFLRSISALRRCRTKRHEDFPQQLAGFKPQTGDNTPRAKKASNKEDRQLVRSAN